MGVAGTHADELTSGEKRPATWNLKAETLKPRPRLESETQTSKPKPQLLRNGIRTAAVQLPMLAALYSGRKGSAS